MLIETFEPGDATRYIVGAAMLDNTAVAACGFEPGAQVMLYMFTSAATRPFPCAEFRYGTVPHEAEYQKWMGKSGAHNIWTIGAGYITLCALMGLEANPSEIVDTVIRQWAADWSLKVGRLRHKMSLMYNL